MCQQWFQRFLWVSMKGNQFLCEYSQLVIEVTKNPTIKRG